MALISEQRVAELNELMPEKIPQDMSKFLLSPMPGLLIKVCVKEGQEVKAGEELAVVEAHENGEQSQSIKRSKKLNRYWDQKEIIYPVDQKDSGFEDLT